MAKQLYVYADGQWIATGSPSTPGLSTAELSAYAKLNDPEQVLSAKAIQAQAFAFDLSTGIRYMDTGEGYGERLVFVRKDAGTEVVEHLIFFSDLTGLQDLPQQVSALTPGEWVRMTLKPEFAAEGGKQPHVRLLPGNRVEVIGEIKRVDGTNFPVDQYISITDLYLPSDCRPEGPEARSWVVPTWGGSPNGAHANIIVNQQGVLQVNPKMTSPMKVDLAGTYYKGAWPK